jgi:beta-glucosidase
MTVIGAATSSLHSEGAAPASDWGGWEANGWVPPSSDGNGFATRYVDDAALLAEHGLGALRLTLEWARLEPRRSDTGFEAVEVERYRAILRAVRDAGLQTWACLVHTSLPGWFSEDERGFLDERSARWLWPQHVDRVGEAFGDLVDGWITVHEPVRHVLGGFLNGTQPPGRTDGDDARKALRLLLEADAAACRLLHVPAGAPVATCRWLPPVVAHEPTPESRAAAAAADELIWRSWRDHDDPDSWLGVSCGAGGIAVDAAGDFHPTAREGLPETLHRISEELPGRPVVLLTGPPDERADTVVREAVEDGVAIEQLHWWSAVDGYEGWAGFDVRTGLFDRDRNPARIEVIRSGP